MSADITMDRQYCWRFALSWCFLVPLFLYKAYDLTWPDWLNALAYIFTYRALNVPNLTSWWTVATFTTVWCCCDVPVIPASHIITSELHRKPNTCINEFNSIMHVLDFRRVAPFRNHSASKVTENQGQFLHFLPLWNYGRGRRNVWINLVSSAQGQVFGTVDFSRGILGRLGD